MLLKPRKSEKVRKSGNYRYRDRCKSDNLRERAIKKISNEIMPKSKEAKKIKGDNFSRSNRENFAGTNTISVYCRYTAM